MIDTVDLLQRLIRVDTTNPPGNEGEAIAIVAAELDRIGVSHRILESPAGRSNLIARIPGVGDAPPLLMQGHVDVVPSDPARWRHPPFSGEIVDGEIWGRGALDMKSGVAMMVGAIDRVLSSGTAPAGDVILAVVADEEAAGTHGARFLVENHAGLFDGVRHCVGEFGGFSFHFAGKTFYPIQVSERRLVTFTLTVRGRPGHGSLPVRGETVGRLGRLLSRLDAMRLPVHLSPASTAMLQGLAAELDGAEARVVQTLLSERTAGIALRTFGSKLAAFEPMLRNTASVTMVNAGVARNVIPAEATVVLDGRMVPGQTPEAFAAEIQNVVGRHVEVAWEAEDAAPPADPDLSLMSVLGEIIRHLDPAGIPLPFLLPAVTDGRWFASLGIQAYGFIPMRLPEDFAFQETVHGVDERIPVDAVEFGTEALARLLGTYRG